MPPSPNSEVPIAYRMEQMKLLGRIEEAVRPIPEMRDDIQDLRVDLARQATKLDDHIQSCQPRRKVVSLDALKENWTVVLLVTQVVVFLALQMTGNTDKAQQVLGSSPAFRKVEGEPD